MMSEQFAEHIGALAKAQAEGSYLGIRMILQKLTLDELRAVRNVIARLSAEVDEYERKASS